MKQNTAKHNTAKRVGNPPTKTTARRKPRPTVEVCLVPNCDNAARCRGVCDGCYQSAWKMVRMGEITFEELEAQGLIKPAYQRKNKLAAAIGK